MKKLSVANYEIINKQVFTVENLYKMVHDWLIENQFFDKVTGDDKFETMYMENIAQDGTKEVNAWWRTEKSIASNKYYKYDLDIEYHVLLMKNVEVTYANQKFKTSHSEVSLKVHANLILDPHDKWTSGFLKRFDNLFRNRIYKVNIEAHMRDLYRQAYDLQARLKQFLKLNQFMEVGAELYPKLGYETR